MKLYKSFVQEICFKIVTFFIEARIAFGCVSSNSDASLVLSKLPAKHERILYEPLFYLAVGTLRWRHYYSHSCEFPILHDCIQISMSRLLRTERQSAISDQFLVQMLNHQVLSKLHCIQAADKLHQRPLSPMSCHRWFPTYHYKTLQHDQHLVNWWDSPHALFLI